MIDSYLKEFAKVTGIGAGFATIPLIASFASLQPPWPPALGHLSACIVLVGVLACWEWVRAGRVGARRAWFRWSIAAIIVGLIPYLLLYSMFVEASPTGEFRVVRGFQCTAKAAMAYSGQCPALDRDALRDVEWEATRLWTPQSVALVRLGLVTTWLLFTVGLASAVGSIVAGRKRVKARPA